jgi:hypothetical protein
MVFNSTWIIFLLSKMVARTDVIRSIQGQRVVIPDLQSLLSDWPKGQSDEEAKVKRDVGKRLDEYVVTGPLHDTLIKRL